MDYGYDFKPYIAIYGLNFLGLVFSAAASPIIENRSLPVDAWYPFDYRASLSSFALAYTQQLITASISFCNNTVEIAFLLFILHCLSQLKFIQKQLSNLTATSTRNEISLIVRNHNQVLR